MMIYAKNIYELNYKYNQYVNERVLDFLEKKGYKVERTKQGINKILQELKRQGKKVTIQTTNNQLNKDRLGFNRIFDLKIDLREISDDR